MNKALIFGFWLIATPATLFSTIYLNKQIEKTNNFTGGIKSSVSIISSQQTPYKMFTAIPGQLGGLAQAIETNDARPLIVENFFRVYDSPLVAYSEQLVQVADKYNLDFRLLPAIAMKESGGGRVIPPNSYNAWGWAIHTTSTRYFTNWEEGIETVANGLRINYLDQGLTTPEEIMTKYTPASIAKGGPWARDVRNYIAQME